MVRNARAKIIERAFLDVKNEFSKMFEGYTGGTIMERPERLKKTGKEAGTSPCCRNLSNTWTST